MLVPRMFATHDPDDAMKRILLVDLSKHGEGRSKISKWRVAADIPEISKAARRVTPGEGLPGICVVFSLTIEGTGKIASIPRLYRSEAQA